MLQLCDVTNSMPMWLMSTLVFIRLDRHNLHENVRIFFYLHLLQLLQISKQTCLSCRRCCIASIIIYQIQFCHHKNMNTFMHNTGNSLVTTLKKHKSNSNNFINPSFTAHPITYSTSLRTLKRSVNVQ